SARVYDRAWRWARHGWKPLDLMQARLLPACVGSGDAVPAVDAGEGSGGTPGGAAAGLRLSPPGWPAKGSNRARLATRWTSGHAGRAPTPTNIKPAADLLQIDF